MHLERTTWDDIRFKELTVSLDQELTGNYGKLQNQYTMKNIIKSNSYVVLCIKNEKAIACGCIRDLGDNSTVELKRMFTIKEERGQSIGKLIVEELEKWAFELHFKRMILETGMKQNSAIAMYQKIGFQIIENYGEYKGISNSICMAKEIRIKW
jgi:GNAT superfamily N-acetyltransferase